MKNISCLRCNREMKYMGKEKLQLGETGWILGDLPNLLAGAMVIDIYTCSQCGKIEFFQPEYETGDNRIALRECPNCGQKHEYDDPKCPFCKYDYNK